MRVPLPVHFSIRCIYFGTVPDVGKDSDAYFFPAREKQSQVTSFRSLGHSGDLNLSHPSSVLSTGSSLKLQNNALIWSGSLQC